MDYYALLKVPSGARQVEIDRAYQKLIKEARYDTSINRKEVEIAYKTLSDATQRALYDAAKAEAVKIKQASLKVKKKELTMDRSRRLVILLSVVVVMMLAYYAFRFGYHFKSFTTGDALYFKDTGRYFGKVLKEESSHMFGSKKRAGYLVKTGDNEDVWFPVSDVKTLCETKK